VICAAPQSTRLLWTQSDNGPQVKLPKSRVVKEQRTHYVLAGSNHSFSTLPVTKDGSAILEQSSLIRKTELSDSSLAMLESGEL